MALVAAPHARFHAFDGVRAMAIGMVMLWHGTTAAKISLMDLGDAAPLVGFGWAGVDLFFALSGFLITWLLLREEDSRVESGLVRGFGLKRFYVRRALRILPVYWVVFGLLTFVFSRSPIFASTNAKNVLHQHLPFAFWPHATLWGNYFGAYLRPIYWGNTRAGAGYSVFWSLCVEEHFYLLWPGFLWLVTSAKARTILIAAVCCGLPVIRYEAVLRGWASETEVHVLSHFRLDALLWGAAGALALHARRDLIERSFIRRGLLILCAVGLMAIVLDGSLSLLPQGTPFGDGFGLSLLGLASTLLLLELAVCETSIPARVLRSVPFRWVGVLSYSMYLIHFPMMDLGRWLLQPAMHWPPASRFFVSMPVYFALTVFSALMLHVSVERPFLRLKARYASAASLS